MSRFTKNIKNLPGVFWVSNIIELFERWAWYGFYNGFFALYLTSGREEGALGFSNVEKGAIMGTGSMILYFLPVITGAIADRIGYKKVLIISFTAYILSFFMLSRFESFELIFAAFICLAVAGALFKPVISGTIARVTDSETASLGFGIFYMIINVGGFIGPFISSLVYKSSWNNVFWISIGAMAVNYIVVFFFYREPALTKTNKTLIQNVGIAFRNIGVTLTDWKYLLFLLVIGIFWSAYNQLYYSFPVFLEQWVSLDRMALSLGLDAGKITTVTITSLASFYIILFQLIISSVTARVRPLNSIMTGIFVLAIGLALMFVNVNPWLIVFGIFIFSLGEMASSPKTQEYIGRIAPSDRKALYMGTSFLPIAFGHFIAGIVSGRPYDLIADKYHLLQKAVADRGFSIEAVSDTFSGSEYFSKARELFGMSEGELTTYLWKTYHPYDIWIIFSGMAVGASVLLFLYDRYILRGGEVNGK